MEHIKDLIGVEGHILAWRGKQELIDRARELLDIWEHRGYSCPNEVPEGELKQEFRELLRQLGLKVGF